MPRLSVWFVRTALAHLAAGFTVGALMLANKGLPIHPALWALLPAHIELLLLGWTLNLIMGVGYWILPRHKQGAPRGATWPVVACYALLNAGVLAVCVAPWLGVSAVAQSGLSFAGRAAEAAAAALFAVHALPRIKPMGM